MTHERTYTHSGYRRENAFGPLREVRQGSVCRKSRRSKSCSLYIHCQQKTLLHQDILTGLEVLALGNKNGACILEIWGMHTAGNLEGHSWTFSTTALQIPRVHPIFLALSLDLWFFSLIDHPPATVCLLGGSSRRNPRVSRDSSWRISFLLLCTYALVRERELRRYLGILVSYWLAPQAIHFWTNRRQARLVSYWSRNEIPVEPANRKPGFLSFVGL